MIPRDPKIYLASRSPRRRELLQQIGVRFELLLFRSAPREDSEVDESYLPGESADDYVVRVCRAKAEHGARQIRQRRLPQRLLLAADTTLDVDGETIVKPHDAADAAAILGRLSGKTHRVLTAVAVVAAERIEHVVSVSEVRFRKLQSDEIRRYVASGESFDKAGAYGIQGHAAMFVEEIRGSHSGIVGLPLCETALLLRRFGYPL
ncbi:MAG: septum formation inhibitor Maf [Betaproteobacteria bacterium]|nr:septum formation inhibitor Maf [Betaproteobacteria bacterium]